MVSSSVVSSSVAVQALLVAMVAATPARSETGSPLLGLRRIELTAEPAAAEPEVLISPGVPTVFVFDTELLRAPGGGDRLELERREGFTWVEGGRAMLQLTPSDTLRAGERPRLTVRFADGAAPREATFRLVVHPGRAERLVEVYREARPVESYQQEAREARADTLACREQLERSKQEQSGPGGLMGLVIAGSIDKTGVATRDINKIASSGHGPPLTADTLRLYRARDRVLVELVMWTSADAPPWRAEGATLTTKAGEPLKVLAVWQERPLTPGGPARRVMVEAEVPEEATSRAWTLKLWEETSGRAVTFANLRFP